MTCSQIMTLLLILSVEGNVCLHWFCFTSLRDLLKFTCQFLDQSEVKPKPIATSSLAFSRAWRRLCALL